MTEEEREHFAEWQLKNVGELLRCNMTWVTLADGSHVIQYQPRQGNLYESEPEQQ